MWNENNKTLRKKGYWAGSRWFEAGLSMRSSRPNLARSEDNDLGLQRRSSQRRESHRTSQHSSYDEAVTFGDDHSGDIEVLRPSETAGVPPRRYSVEDVYGEGWDRI